MNRKTGEVELALKEIRRMMAESGLSETRIASRAGISPGYVTKLLTGKPEIKIWQILAILDVLKCNPSDFFRKVYGAPRSALAEIKRNAGSAKMLEVDDRFVQPVREIKARLRRVEEAIRQIPIPGRKNVQRTSPADTPRAMKRRRVESHGKRPERWPDPGMSDCRPVKIWIPVALLDRMDRALSLRPEGEPECTRRDLLLTALTDWVEQCGGQ